MNIKELNTKGLKGNARKKEVERYISEVMLEAMNSNSGGHWTKSWLSGVGGAANLPTRLTGENYQGWNQFHLLMQAKAKGFTSNHWGTFNGWKEKGFMVQKGQKSTPVIFAKYVFDDDEETGKSVFKYFVYNIYSVFNACQVADSNGNFADQSELYSPKPAPTQEFTNKLCEKVAKEYLESQKIEVSRISGSASPFYNRTQDFIGMPLLSDFINTDDATAEQNYFATLFHEIGHSTGHESRLDRKFGNKFGDDDYAFEELVAELTSAFISGHTGLEPTPALNHASYLQSWNKRFKEDSRYFVKAIKLASRASQFFIDNTSLKVAKPEPKEEVKKEPVKFETVALIKREELSA